MSKEKKEPEHFHIYIADEKPEELLVVEASGKIRLKGKEVSTEEFIRFLTTY